MATISTARLLGRLIVVVSFAAAVMVGCSGPESSPTAPTRAAVAPAPALAPAPAPAPAGPGALNITITPNPVAWSDVPIEGCSLPNTWQYDQVLSNTGATRLTISDRADSFDGVQTSARSGLGIVLVPGAQTSIRTRWCSANATEHRTQTRFTGSDDAANRIDQTGPVVLLMAR
jgi:hypothetical protein